MSIIKIQPVILCGGSGTRLWPLSRNGFPKQFLCLNANVSLFQQTAQRLAAINSPHMSVSSPFTVCGEDHRFLVSEQLREVGITLGTTLLEPVSRNTAPALTLAAFAATHNGQDPILVVTPSDHAIGSVEAFNSALQNGIKVAADGTIVIMGVAPTKAETGYGYIQIESPSDVQDITTSSLQATSGAIHLVKRFVEKPNLETAEKYQLDAAYYWNAGIFILKASSWLKALERFRPDILRATKAAWVSKTQEGLFVRPGKAEFAAISAESVDYAVMENCPGSPFAIKMVPLDAGWSDLGSWDSVWKVQAKDAQGNVKVGDVFIQNSCNTLVHATSRLVALVGVQDLVVVETADSVLVANQHSSQDVKQIVKQLKSLNREEQSIHRKVHRPWGWYDCIDEGIRFKVKRIMVKPNASLSLQRHLHRAEHWIVVTGIAEITKGNQVFTLTENQSTYIPLGVVHRLANPGSTPLEIIEVQSGNYLSEDDIIRIEDSYGRQ